MATSKVLPSRPAIHSAFSKALHLLDLPARLEAVGARRGGTSAFEIARQVIAGLLNQAPSLLRGLDRCAVLVKRAVGEDTVYRTLADLRLRFWELLPGLSSAQNTRDDDLLIIDDTPIAKPRSRKLAGLSWTYSTTLRKTVHGFCLVGLYHLGQALRGFVGFRLRVGSQSLPGTGRQGRPSVVEHESRSKTKSQLALEMITAVVAAGNRARHVVFDSAYFGRVLLLALKQAGFAVYTRAKANNVFFIDGVKIKALAWAKSMTSYKLYRNTDIRYATSLATWKGVGEVKLVRVQFLPTGEKRTQHAVLVCSDVTVSASQIIERYLKRWGIEVEFRNAKSEFGLERVHVRTFQSILNYFSLTLLTARLARMMQALLHWTGLAIPALMEALRFHAQDLQAAICSADVTELETMMPTGSDRSAFAGSMITSEFAIMCGT